MEIYRERQLAFEAGDNQRVKTLTNQHKRSISRDKQNFYCRNFEEELWYDVKAAKSAYVPKHTRPLEKDDCVGKT